MSKPKQQGTAFESWVVKQLGRFGARRLPEGGSNDLGDLDFVDAAGQTWIAECKATQTLNVTRVLAKTREKAGTPYSVLLWKRLVKLKDGQKNRRPDGEALVVVMAWDTYVELLERRR